MKKSIIFALIMLGAAIIAAQTLSASTVVAQATREPQKAATSGDQPPAIQTEAPPPSAPAEQAAPAAAETPPEAQPAPAGQMTTEPAEPPPAANPAPPAETAPRKASEKQPHREYAEMSSKECSGCHTGSGVAPNHGAAWSREHRVPAAKPGKNCAECHVQQFCLDCHSGGGIQADLSVDTAKMNYVPHSHRTDFRELHPLKALDNPQTCTRCHDSRFCSDCHAKYPRSNLMVQSHRRAWSDLKVPPIGQAHSTFTTAQCQTCHPNGYLPKHVWSTDHAREARRNLQSCQTCHSDGLVCQTCHSARFGLRVNPHPRNWNAVKGKYRSKSGGRTCIACHDAY